MPALKTSGVPRRGLTLLEVMLALGILGASLALVGELVRLASRNAAASHDVVRAQLVAESVLAQLRTGMLPLEGIQQAPVENETDWVYSVLIEPAGQANLVAVSVLVEHAQETNPTSFALTQWLPDPNQVLREADMPSATAGETSSTTTPEK